MLLVLLILATIHGFWGQAGSVGVSLCNRETEAQGGGAAVGFGACELPGSMVCRFI